MKWSKKFPTKEGDYWFYGYRYGKISCGQVQEKEFVRVKVLKCSNGLLYNAEGHFMYESEVEEAIFTPIVFPKIP